LLDVEGDDEDDGKHERQQRAEEHPQPGDGLAVDELRRLAGDVER